MSLASRFWAKVDKTGDCWIWTGCVIRNGYGQTSRDGKREYAHRVAYELVKGPIPDGLTIDHLCRVRSCVRPSHLEAVANRVNILRGVGPSARNAVKTQCDHGHLFTPENTIFDGAKRKCRKCKARIDRNSSSRRREVVISLAS